MKTVVIGPVKDLKSNDKKIADEGFVTGLSVIDETDEFDKWRSK